MFTIFYFVRNVSWCAKTSIVWTIYQLKYMLVLYVLFKFNVEQATTINVHILNMYLS